MPDTPSKSIELEDEDWEVLLRRISKGTCTPFIGSGACVPILQTGSKIANGWADAHNYPYTDSRDRSNLVQVAQFLAIKYGDNVTPKEKIIDEHFNDIKYPNFKLHADAHGVLADLPVSMYITTNYDDFMVEALRAHSKDPKAEYCRWHQGLGEDENLFDGDYVPSPQQPLVYHLHGIKDKVESIVLTEDDYIDFLVQLSEGSSIIPPPVQAALASNSLLFIGYSLQDINFRVLFRGILNTVARGQKRKSFTLQFQESDYDAGVLEYVDRYFGSLDIKVAWGSANDFATELYARWEELNDGS